MTDLSEFGREFEKFEDTVLFLRGEEERKLIIEFADKIERLLIEYPANPDLHHKLGLCFYNISEWEEEDKRRIEIAFQRAILLEPRSNFSLLFLTFFYFDIGQYYLSMQCYENFLKVPIGKMQLWRLEKLAGINLACLIYTQQIDVSEVRHSIDKLIDRLSKFDEEDLELVEPIELIAALENMGLSNDDEITVKIKKLEKFLDY